MKGGIFMKYALVNGIILNGNYDMVPVKDKIIFVNNGVIEKIAAEGEPVAGYEIIDMKGKYVLPGLINLHVHIPATGKPKKKQADLPKLVNFFTSNAFMRRVAYKVTTATAQQELLSGVTTIRTVGGIADFDSKFRDEINSGKKQGPKMIVSNMAVSVPGGHMAGSLAYEAKSADEAKMYVDEIAKTNPDLIKLMITGGVMDAKVKGEPGELKMPPEYVKAACDEAHKLGYKVAAHVESTQGVKVALENGVDTIEHGAEPTPEILELFKTKNAALVTTISPAFPYAIFDTSVSHATDEQKFNGNIVLNGIVDCAKECLKNGVMVGLGTDTGCPYITHYDMWRELNYFCNFCGVSSKFAIYTATKVNSEILGLSDKIGTLEQGKVADIIAVEKNPIDDITALRNVSFVMANGKIADVSKLKKDDEIEHQLDKYVNYKLN